jgi:hypothetical protein
VEQHQREQSGQLSRRPIPEERAHDARETDGLGGEIRPYDRCPACRGVPLVEEEVEHREHGVQALRQLIRLGDRVGDLRGGDLPLRPDETLRHRRGRDEKRPRDLVRAEADESTEREGDLGLQRERRMAAGEDEAEKIVGDLEREVRPGGDLVEICRIRFELSGQDLLPAEPVDGDGARSLDEPGARVLGHAPVAPAAQRRFECVLGRLFGQAEVARQADQGSENARPLNAVNPGNYGVDLLDHGG